MSEHNEHESKSEAEGEPRDRLPNWSPSTWVVVLGAAMALGGSAYVTQDRQNALKDRYEEHLKSEEKTIERFDRVTQDHTTKIQVLEDRTQTILKNQEDQKTLLDKIIGLLTTPVKR